MTKKIDPGEKAVAELDALGESHAALTQTLHDKAVSLGAICKPNLAVASRFPNPLHNGTVQRYHDKMRQMGAKCLPAQPAGVIAQYSHGNISEERRRELLSKSDGGKNILRGEGEL